MAVTHWGTRGSGYNANAGTFPALRIGAVGYTGFRGSAALPSFYWEEDEDTGIYSSGANAVDITAGGTRIATFDSSGLTLTTGGVVNSGVITGQLGATADWEVMISAADLPAIRFTTGTWTNTRAAAGDYKVRKTAADSTSTIEIPLNFNGFPNRKTASKGFQITTIDYIYGVVAAGGGAPLDSHTYDILATTYANGQANSVVTTPGGTLTGTLATATAAQPIVTTITLGTPYFIPTNTVVTLQIVVDTGTEAVYDCYGAIFRGTRVL